MRPWKTRTGQVYGKEAASGGGILEAVFLPPDYPGRTAVAATSILPLYHRKLLFRYVNFALMMYAAIKSKHLWIVENCNVLSSPTDVCSSFARAIIALGKYGQRFKDSW